MFGFDGELIEGEKIEIEDDVSDKEYENATFD
jgi:hypothetical protein